MKCSLRQATWLLRCAGFGADPLEVARVQRLGYAAWLEQQCRAPIANGPTPWHSRIPPGITMGILQVAGLMGWWLERMARGGLREKMTLFWHGFFTTAADPVFSSGLLLCQNQILRQGALGRFSDLLQQVSRDPAMLVYLDGFRNRAEHPNENFAREVMELFTTGPGHYSEADLREAARAFTGWEIAWLKGVQFRNNPAHHDHAPKRFKDLRGQLEGEQVLAHLAKDPATARHVTARLWDFLVGTPLEESEHKRLARVFQERHGNIGLVVRSLFLGEAFVEAGRQRQVIKSPIELYIELNRIFARPFHLNDCHSLRMMGQLPFTPPSVAGWRGGKAWLDTATLQQRLAFIQGISRSKSLFDSKASGRERLWKTHQQDLSLSEELDQELILMSPEVQLK
jgi:uncharacterized protein (DUF1800 family)